MKLISYECPYEEYVVYRKERDEFQSVLLATIEDETYGVIECEVELQKIFPYTEWKIGAIYFFNQKYSKEYVHTLRKWLHIEISELYEKLKMEEEYIRKKYERVPKIEILQVERRKRYLIDYEEEGKVVYQSYKVKLAPFNKFFPVYVKKKKNQNFLIIEMRKQNHEKGSWDCLWYPDWRKDFNLEVLHYWKNETGGLLEEEEKIILYENTIKKWDTVRNNIYNRGGEKERA